jgi:hypothetical protein
MVSPHLRASRDLRKGVGAERSKLVGILDLKHAEKTLLQDSKPLLFCAQKQLCKIEEQKCMFMVVIYI